MFTKLKDRLNPLKALTFTKTEQRADLAAVRSLIDSTIAEVGRVFGRIGTNLGELDDKTQSLRHDCQVLLANAGGQNDSTQLLLRVAETLESPMDFLNTCLGNQRRKQELMLSCQENTADLLRMQTDMVSSLEPLKFMLVFFKIEASQLSEENRQTFHSVSEEISHLHLLVEETFQKNISNLKNARAAIFTAEKTSETERETQARLVFAKQAEITEAISTLKRQIRGNSLKPADLDNAANSFEQAIGRLVMSLQYEDIIRQRCESILAEIDNKPAELTQATWLVVLSKQIETAAEELRQSSQEIEFGLSTIARQAKELYRASTTMDQFEHITASADGMVQTLLESLESIKLMLSQSTELSKNSKQAIEPVQNLTKELSAIVFEVSIKIQFIALNAQVRSIQVGEGSGLEVLAARTAEISATLRELGDRTAQKISALHETVSELVQTIDTELGSGTKQISSLADHGHILEIDLHNLRDGTFKSLELVANLSETVQNFTSEDSLHLDQLTHHSKLLIEQAEKLRSQANREQLPADQRQALDQDVQRFLSKTHGAMHTRIHVGHDRDAKSFDLGISRQLESRSASSKSLACDNIELF